MRTTVTPDETAAVCPECGRPLPDDRLRTLHRGIEHFETLAEPEREAFLAAYRDETDEIRLFRLKALGTLILLYFGFLFAYSIFG